MIVAHHTRRGRHIFLLLLVLLISLLPDLVFLAEVDTRDKRAYAALVLVPVNGLLKVIGAAAAYWVFMSLGGTWSLAENTVALEGGGGDRTPSVSESGGMPRSYSEADSVGYREMPPSGISFYSTSQSTPQR
jgi:hypothetical protein